MAKWTEQKRRYRQYKARVEQLPASHGAAVEAVEQYVVRFGPGTGETLVPMLEDLVATFERAAAEGTPVRAVVGDDPVQFVEDFLRGYPSAAWITSERERLTAAIDRAVADSVEI
jgi:DNA-binding ferritin-like protein (Dps family)